LFIVVFSYCLLSFFNKIFIVKKEISKAVFEDCKIILLYLFRFSKTKINELNQNIIGPGNKRISYR